MCAGTRTMKNAHWKHENLKYKKKKKRKKKKKTHLLHECKMTAAKRIWM